MQTANDQINQLVWTEELIGRFWDGVGRTSLDELSFGKLAGPQLINFLNEYLAAGATVCDYGAGGGHLARLLVRRGFPTAIYEPSRERAEKLRREFETVEGFLGVISAEDSPRFEALIMSEVVEHLPDGVLHRTLERGRALLVNGGTIVVTTPNNENLEHGAVYCPQCNAMFHRWQHLRSFTARSLAELLDDHGFKSKSIGLVDFSDDAETIDRSRFMPALVRLTDLLGSEAARFERQLQRPESATGALSDGERNVVRAFIAGHQAATANRIRQMTEAMPLAFLVPVLLQLCGAFYTRLATILQPNDGLGLAAQYWRQRLRWAVAKLRTAAPPRPGSQLESISEQLNQVGERIAAAVDAFTAPKLDRAALGYDFYRGRGSTILYVGEKR
jgi:2-polyprenyl-3-methyl-5-hydroxy-6-metoxy-1,4-benzoquinol methylase